MFFFAILQYFGNILHLIDSPRCALQDKVNIIIVALLGVRDVIQNGRHILLKIKVYRKNAEIANIVC